MINRKDIFKNTDEIQKFKELYLKENPNATVDASHECVGETIEQEHFYGVNKYYKGFAYLDITLINKNNKATFSLFKREITESLDLDLDYILGNYEVNVYDVVNSDSIVMTVDAVKTIEEVLA